MRLGVISDIHGVDVALRGVLDDGRRLGVDRWWASSVGFDVDSIVDALERRRHPNREFVTSVLTRGTFVQNDARR